MKKQTKMISLLLIILLMLQIIIPMMTNIEIDTSYALTNISYFKEADKITCVGMDSSGTNGDGNPNVTYTNTSVDNSKYIVYSNAVQGKDGNQYDLVIYPFKIDYNVKIVKNKIVWLEAAKGYNGFKFVITQHGDINSCVNMDVLLSFVDLDVNEYCILPSNFTVLHLGEKVTYENVSEGKKYVGNTEAVSEKQMFNYNSVMGSITIPTSGIVLYYGADRR